MGREPEDGSLIYGKGARRWEVNLWEGSKKKGEAKFMGREPEDESLIYGKGARRREVNLWEGSQKMRA